MRNIRTTIAAGLTVFSLAGFGIVQAGATAQAAPASPARAVAPMAVKYKFKNCTALNKVYRHGVGKANAKDKTSGKRVTNFKRSTSLYKKVIGYRKGLDRDKDGIACEKR